MVSADHIRREQQRDEFAKELLRRLQESGQEYVGAEKRTQRRGKPPAGQESKWEEIYGEFSSSQVEILAPKFDLQSDGKVPEPVCRKVDTWLRRAMKSSPRAVLALSYPNGAEIKLQNRYKQRSMKLR